MHILRRLDEGEGEGADDARTMALLANKRIVTIGGGTGPFALLSELKRYPCSLTAVVTMSDSGGSSRRLMDEFGQLPVGDLRQALVALSRKGAMWRDIYTFRFGREHHRAGDGGAASARHDGSQRGGISGHSLGNLIISALQQLNGGSLLWALQDAQELLDTAGRVLPVTLAPATLCAELESGEIICGESDIDTRGERCAGPLEPIRRVFLQRDVPACEETIHAIRRADLIILGPGDLYTSILPNLLVRGVAEAIRASDARKVYICNLMTKRGETDGYRASDFVREIHDYLGGGVSRVIMHDQSFPDDVLSLYARVGQYPVMADDEAVLRMAPEVVVDSMLSVHSSHLVRHNAERLVRALVAPSDAAQQVHALEASLPARYRKALA